MKTCAIVGLLALVAGSASAQTASKAAPAAGLGKSAVGSNEDANIRAYIELLRTDVRNSKSGLMGEVMQLDAGEAAEFWPIYKDFETEFSALGDKVSGVVKTYSENYDKMSDPVADKIATQLLAIEQQRNELKKQYYTRIKAAMGAIMAARFLQVENQLERLIDLQIAAGLPVISKH
jgi:hypothetical protein